MSIVSFSTATAPRASSIIDAARERRTAPADEIVISAGVYNSPAILQRSGIGPADWLRPLGIDVVADLPVGTQPHSTIRASP